MPEPKVDPGALTPGAGVLGVFGVMLRCIGCAAVGAVRVVGGAE
jgi:hypothetical protein